MRGVDLRTMPMSTFLDVVYSHLVEFLPPNEKNRDHRQELDRDLNVRSWRMPGSVQKHKPKPTGVPDWWDGDEDASQTFLSAMGVRFYG